MRVILVDDERLMLRSMQKLLEKIEDVEIIGTYIDAEKALEELAVKRPDIVFLDISMPGLDGIGAAGRIAAISPTTDIVFATAHENYAVKAFELQAQDYILKPISKDRLMATIERLRARRQLMQHRQDDGGAAVLQCMTRLQVHMNDGRLIALKWRTAKVKELFAYLLHNRRQVISKDTLIELLWPDADEKKGLTNLQTSIYRIRQLLKEEGLQQYIDIQFLQYGYMLEVRKLFIDTEVWESKLQKLGPVGERNFAQHSKLFHEYSGDYLMEDNYFWAETERHRLKTIWHMHAQMLSQFYSKRNMEMEAVAVFHRIIKLHPLHEEAYLQLMRIYDRLNDHGSVELQYRQLVQALREDADAEPSRQTQEWYASWKGRERKKG